MSVLSGASTFALGEVFKKHFETGGTFLDFDPGRLKNYYNEKFEKGKEMAADLQKKNESQAKTSDASTAIDKLKDIVEMKENGNLTEEEFQVMKKKIIES